MQQKQKSSKGAEPVDALEAAATVAEVEEAARAIRESVVEFYLVAEKAREVLKGPLLDHDSQWSNLAKLFHHAGMSLAFVLQQQPLASRVGFLKVAAADLDEEALRREAGIVARRLTELREQADQAARDEVVATKANVKH